MDHLVVSSRLFGLNLLTECHDLSCSVHIYYVSTQLSQVLQPESISFVWRIKSNSPFLISDNCLYYDVIPFASTWKMVKEAPNHVQMNMVGYSQTSLKILEDGNILIFPVV